MDPKEVNEFDAYMERRELVQDVIDRLLSNPEYKAELKKLNERLPNLIDYNRNLKNPKVESN